MFSVTGSAGLGSRSNQLDRITPSLSKDHQADLLDKRRLVGHCVWGAMVWSQKHATNLARGSPPISTTLLQLASDQIGERTPDTSTMNSNNRFDRGRRAVLWRASARRADPRAEIHTMELRPPSVGRQSIDMFRFSTQQNPFQFGASEALAWPASSQHAPDRTLPGSTIRHLRPTLLKRDQDSLLPTRNCQLSIVSAKHPAPQSSRCLGHDSCTTPDPEILA